MRLTALHGLLMGIALAAFVVIGGRQAAHYFDEQAAEQGAISAKVQSEFDACVKAYYAAHPAAEILDRTFIDLKSVSKVSIPCANDGEAAAVDASEAGKKYASIFRQWSPRLAVALLLVFAMPWFWQFLLRRVAEVGSAFRGGPRI